MIGNRKEEYAPFYCTMLEKAHHPVRKDLRTAILSPKSQSPSWDLTQACLDRMLSTLYNLRHHHSVGQTFCFAMIFLPPLYAKTWNWTHVCRVTHPRQTLFQDAFIDWACQGKVNNVCLKPLKDCSCLITITTDDTAVGSTDERTQCWAVESCSQK